MKPIRTDFKGYEGKYVATDTRTGQIVIADEDLTSIHRFTRTDRDVVADSGVKGENRRP